MTEPLPLRDEIDAALRPMLAEAVGVPEHLCAGVSALMADAALRLTRQRLLDRITANRQRGFAYLRKLDVYEVLGEASATPEPPAQHKPERGPGCPACEWTGRHKGSVFPGPCPHCAPEAYSLPSHTQEQP